MNAGNLDSRITVKTLVSQSVDIHGETIPYYTSSSIWAKAKSMNGSESTPNGVSVVNSSYQFTIRNGAANVDEETVIIFNNYEYNVRYIDQPFGRNQWLVISADRVVQGG